MVPSILKGAGGERDDEEEAKKDAICLLRRVQGAAIWHLSVYSIREK
jgi:hypothetical protein